MLGAMVMVAMARAATIPVALEDQSCQHVAAGSPGDMCSQVRAGCVWGAGCSDAALFISQTVRVGKQLLAQGFLAQAGPGHPAQAGSSLGWKHRMCQHRAHTAHRQVRLAAAQQ